MRHVYVHVPFCARRCAYCDFAIAVRPRVPVAEYVQGIAAELALRFGPPTALQPVDTVYLGGGTPSRLGGEGIAQLLGVLRKRFTWDATAEVTVEANPEDVTDEAARRWREAGVTRVSLGAQSFAPTVLAWMHRTHDAVAIGSAVETLRRAGIHGLSVDLIFALPAALGRDWAADLRQAIALAPDHLSVYGLTVEPFTPLGRWRDRGETHEAPEELYEREFLQAHDVLGAAGYAHYEVSNYARADRRARHNSAYWRGVPYLGLGPSAHGFDGTERRWNVAAYAAWQEAVTGAVPHDPVEGRETLDDEARAAERVYLGLRTSDGLLARPDELAAAAAWIAQGWATVEGDRLRLTPAGWLRMDALATALTTVGSR